MQKILAHAGLGSRRECEEYILQGRITVDGKVARELGTRVAPGQAIAVDGERIKLEKLVYYAVNKPKGYVSTNHDPAGRPRVVDLLPDVPERVYSVGRLDEDSTGLMILTNDGELANRLAHPRYGVEKTYRALVAGAPSPEVIRKLGEGIWLSDGKVRAKRARIVGTQGEATQVELVLAEGKKREIRRMLAKLGHKVMLLTRIAIGPVILKGLSVGEHRPLSRAEIELLQKVAAGIQVSSPRFLNRERSGGPRPGRPSARRPQGQGQGEGRGRTVGAEGRRDRPPRASDHQRREHAPRERSSDQRPMPGRPPRAERPGQAAHPRPTPGKPLPGKPIPGKPLPGKKRDLEGQPVIEKPSAALPGRRPSPTEGKPPGRPPLPSADRPRPRTSESGSPGRRIIGLAPRVAEEAGLTLTGKPPRKRPVIKRKPPRRTFGIRRHDEEEGGSEA